MPNRSEQFQKKFKTNQFSSSRAGLGARKGVEGSNRPRPREPARTVLSQSPRYALTLYEYIVRLNHRVSSRVYESGDDAGLSLSLAAQRAESVVVIIVVSLVCFTQHADGRKKKSTYIILYNSPAAFVRNRDRNTLRPFGSRIRRCQSLPAATTGADPPAHTCC